MESGGNMVQSKLCRLCAEEKDSFVRIYEEEGQKLNLATKIIQCLQIWLYPEDPLPKAVCIVCCAKLNQYFDFFETTSRAQRSLQIMFDPKMSNNKSTKEDGSVTVSRSKNLNKTEVKSENEDDEGDSLTPNRSLEEDDEGDAKPPELVECVLSDKDSSFSNCRKTPSRRKCRNPIKRTAPVREKEKVCSKDRTPKERGTGKTRAQTHAIEDPFETDCVTLQESIPLQERLLLIEEEKISKLKEAMKVPNEDTRTRCENGKQVRIKEEEESDRSKSAKSDANTPSTQTPEEADGATQPTGGKRPRGKKKNVPKPGEKPPRPKTVMEGYPWQCTTCPSVLCSLQELRKHHQDVHQQPPTFKCVQCTKTYTRYRSFARHVKLHRNPKKYKCEECGKCFSQKTVLQSHSTVHTDARPHVCPQCGKAFKQFSSLYLHSKCHLPDQVKPKFPCDVCHKEFATKHTLETHRKIHTGERNFICDICGKSFIAKGSLDYHILTHSGEKPHHCSVCGKGFKTARLLGKHATLHTGVKPHQCDVCGKQFRERGALREHNRIHTGAMPYTCEFCGKNFRFKGILTVHRRQHTGERPYGCAECRREFTNWANYNKHMKRRHRPPDANAPGAAAVATAGAPLANVTNAHTAIPSAQRTNYQNPEVSGAPSNPTLSVRPQQSVATSNSVDTGTSVAVPASLPISALGNSYHLSQHSAMCENSNGSSVNSLTPSMSPSVMPTGTSMYGSPNQGTKMGSIYGPPGASNSLTAGIPNKLPMSSSLSSMLHGSSGVVGAIGVNSHKMPMGLTAGDNANSLTAGIPNKLSMPSSLSSMLHGSSGIVGAIGGNSHKMPMGNVFHVSQHHNHVSGERTIERSQPNNPLVGSYVPSYVPTGLPMGGMGYYIPPIHHTDHGIEMLHNRSGSSQ